MAKTISNIFLIIILTGCASIPSGKVKLENYPVVSEEKTKNLDISFDIVPYEKGEDLNSNFLIVNDKLKINQKNKNTACVAKISSRADEKEVRKLNFGDIFRLPYYVVCQLSLTIIPCYKQNNFEAKATLISTKDNKILKEYHLKDKAHEVWSFLMLLAAIPINSLRDIPTPESANKQIEQTISEALTRQIFHDASEFPECQKIKKNYQ